MKTIDKTPVKEEARLTTNELNQMERNEIEKDLYSINSERDAIFLSISESETGIATSEQQVQLNELEQRESSIQTKQEDWEISNVPTLSPYMEEFGEDERELEKEAFKDTLNELEQLREMDTTQDLEQDL
jgi:hypothetical protein